MATAIEAIEAAELKLATAYFGLDDMEQRPDRFHSGLMNAIVFARMATLSLQNMSSGVPEFSRWYKGKVEKMAADDAMIYFRDIRNEIEHAVSKTVSLSAKVSFSTDDLKMFQPGPPGATRLVLGAAKYGGASGWEILREDGERDFYFVNVPQTMMTVTMRLVGAPDGIANLDAREAVRSHLIKLDAIVRAARERFL